MYCESRSGDVYIYLYVADYGKDYRGPGINQGVLLSRMGFELGKPVAWGKVQDRVARMKLLVLEFRMIICIIRLKVGNKE